MKRSLWLTLPLALLALLIAGCYTQFYRPGMNMAGQGPYDTLYNRNDSTAIDTTLTADTTQYYPPDERWNSWYYWGRPRGYTRWGFDFNNFSPDYYWSYYGYYDYYGTPWWYDWYGPGYWGNNPWGGTGVPAEPPSQRPHGRRDYGSSGANAQPAPTQSGSPTYAQPSNPSPPPANKNDNNAQKQSDDGKREGKRGH
jgi:hypothetical protein